MGRPIGAARVSKRLPLPTDPLPSNFRPTQKDENQRVFDRAAPIKFFTGLSRPSSKQSSLARPPGEHTVYIPVSWNDRVSTATPGARSWKRKPCTTHSRRAGLLPPAKLR